MSFFIRKPASKRKRDKGFQNTTKIAGAKELKNKIDDEDSDFSSGNESDQGVDQTYSDDEDTFISAQEKKVKLAKKYLKEIEEQEREKILNDEGNVEKHILKRLTEDELAKAGKLKRKLASNVIPVLSEQQQLKCKEHRLSITCIVLSSDNRFIYSSSKEASIVKWCILSYTKLNSVFPMQIKKKSRGISSVNMRCHESIVNCLAISFDNKFLVSGDENGNIIIWNPETLDFIHKFKGHKDSVNGVAICKATNFLYSVSHDSLVKVWTLNDLSYMETLYGHQDKVTTVDVLQKDRVVTSGGFDHTIRVWKVDQESQLVFHGPRGSVDMVKRLDNNHFVSCGDHGVLSLWTIVKKNPLFNATNAHGLNEVNSQPNWISSVGVLYNSDLIATGSCDGFVRLWKWTDGSNSLKLVNTIAVIGFVNGIQFTSDGKYLILAVSKEHRLGRWNCIKEAKNTIVIVPLKIKEKNI